MTWPCRLIESPELRDDGGVDFDKRVVGDMWFLDCSPDELQQRHLSSHYFAHNAGRRPLVCKLSGNLYFVVDGMCYNRERGYYDGWQVSGSPPLITVAPSINFERAYHGFLQNGVISDDVEGRKYGAGGELL